MSKRASSHSTNNSSPLQPMSTRPSLISAGKCCDETTTRMTRERKRILHGQMTRMPGDAAGRSGRTNVRFSELAFSAYRRLYGFFWSAR